MFNDNNDEWLSIGDGESANGHSFNRPSLEEVDSLADELAAEYNNQYYRAWYCGIIYKFGIERVKQWQARCRNAKNPGLLFASYAKQAKPLPFSPEVNLDDKPKTSEAETLSNAETPKDITPRQIALNAMSESLGEKAKTNNLYNHLNPDGNRKPWGKK